MARPRIEWNAEASKLVLERSRYGATQEEIATDLNIAINTLTRLYRKELNEGKAHADIVIRQRIYQIAVGRWDEKNRVWIEPPDKTMLMFLGKTRLGMRETNRVEMTSPDGSMTVMPTTITLTGRKDPEGENDGYPDSSETD